MVVGFGIGLVSRNKNVMGVTASVCPYSQVWSGWLMFFHVLPGFCTGVMLAGTIAFASLDMTTTSSAFSAA